MRRLVWFATVLACGSATEQTGSPSSGPPAPTQTVLVSVSPAQVSLLLNGTQKFTATVSGSANGSVAWSVVEGTGGAIATDGTYTAPANAGTFHVVATAEADPQKSASATVTVSAAPVASISISPATAGLKPGETAQFHAAVTGVSDLGVLWSVSEGASGGSIDANGSYTAPQTAGPYHVVATSHFDPSKTAAAEVTVSAAPAISVSIDPPALALDAGATQRFSATVTGTSDSSVTWSATGGSIDSTGLYTAPQTAGSFQVVASSHADPSRTAAAAVTIVAQTGAVLAACGSITSSGTYSVTADLSSAAEICLDIHDAKNVTVDCGGHSLSAQRALRVSNVDGFPITNCKFVSTNYVPVDQASNGLFQHDQFGASTVLAVQPSDLRFDQNTFAGSYEQEYAQRVVFSNNTLVNQAGATMAAMILSQFGSNNQITGNVIDGKWVGSGQTQADDGILIGDESGDTVSANSMSNLFDCGIETTGVVANATFSDNSITHTGFCGIGGWYWNSLSNCTLSGNTADTVPQLFHFTRIFGLRPAGFDSLRKLPADTGVYFTNNVFDGNRLVNPTTQLGTFSALILLNVDMGYDGAVSAIPGERAATPSDFFLKFNTFSNDDFGHSFQAPLFGSPVVPGRAVDGGGNICSDGGGGYPLICH